MYFPDIEWLTTTLQTLVVALAHARDAGAMRCAEICLVDNAAASADSPYRALLDSSCQRFGWIESSVIAGHGNVGYGHANNLAIARYAESAFHLVLNPDVKLDEAAITNALRYLQQHADCAMVSPVATAADGKPLYLLKRFPDFFTLLLRGFAPEVVKQFFRARLDAYEHREMSFDAGVENAKIASGCFMLVRRSALIRTAGFDPSFFLYFEDFDLSYRIAQFARIARVADVRIVHAGGSAATKGWKHVWLFLRSALRFHWKHR